jgi:hypothetical protein
LLHPRTRRKSAAAAAVLLLVFAGVLIWLLAEGKSGADCACFGTMIRLRVGPWHVLENIALALLAGALALGAERSGAPPTRNDRECERGNGKECPWVTPSVLANLRKRGHNGASSLTCVGDAGEAFRAPRLGVAPKLLQPHRLPAVDSPRPQCRELCPNCKSLPYRSLRANNPEQPKSEGVTPPAPRAGVSGVSIRDAASTRILEFPN